jgi:hypothetical protein
MSVIGLGYIFLAAYGRKRDGHILWNSRVPLSGNGLTPKTGSPSRLYRIVVVTLIAVYWIALSFRHPDMARK